MASRCTPETGCVRCQNCIVLRRAQGAVVFEDVVFWRAGLQRRADCDARYTRAQSAALGAVIVEYDSAVVRGRGPGKEADRP